jgi:hypothetical protein
VERVTAQPVQSCVDPAHEAHVSRVLAARPDLLDGVNDGADGAFVELIETPLPGARVTSSHITRREA